MDEPPFRAPHHTASAPAIVGGGVGPRPGEVSLAHHGVLLLDELGEFVRPAIESLRQPLEDGTVSVARVTGRIVFPARFVLVGTMNLCPCGARGDPGVECGCSPQRLSAYREKVSRALLDRFDLVVHLPRAPAREFEHGRASRRRTSGRGSRTRRPAWWRNVRASSLPLKSFSHVRSTRFPSRRAVGRESVAWHGPSLHSPATPR